MRTSLVRQGMAAAMVLAGMCAFAGPLFAQQAHVVRPGETLWGISGERYGQPTRWPDVQRRNGIAEPRRLQPGTVLYFADGRLLGEDEAMVLAVAGKAWRRHGGGADEPLAPGAAVRAGDVVATEAKGFLTLGLQDGSRSVIPSGSAVEVERIGRGGVRLRLLHGEIESQVRRQQPGQEFEIRSRSVVLGVRGTHFRVRDRDGHLTGEVIEGQVAVQGGGAAPLLLDAGQGAVLAGASGRAEARPLLPAPRFTGQAFSEAAPTTAAVGAVPGAQGYRWRVAQDDLFLAPVAEFASEDATLPLPADLDPGFYHLSVAALDADRLEGMPGERLFYMPAPQGGMRRLADGRVEIRWAASSARRYRLELSLEPDFAATAVDLKGLQATGAVVGPFAIDGRYHWRVSETSDGEHYGRPFAGGSFDASAR